MATAADKWNKAAEFIESCKWLGQDAVIAANYKKIVEDIMEKAQTL